MNAIRKNVFGYHSFTVVVGVLYFYGSSYGFNFLGPIISPLYQIIQPAPENFIGSAVINFSVAFLAALFPVLILVALIHFVLFPKTKLFLVGASLSFTTLSTWAVFTNCSGYPGCTPNLSGKSLGALAALLAVGFIYCKLKPNNEIQATREKSARRLI